MLNYTNALYAFNLTLLANLFFLDNHSGNVN